ncbi:MAG: hypothetical protein ACK4TO_01495 [Candidatus Nitrosotenuis sp.]
MKRLACAIFVIILVLALFANTAFAEQKNQEYKIKYAIKKNIRDLNSPDDSKSVKVTQITKSRMLAILYIVTVEACAGRERLYSPELELKSDRDTLRVKIVGLIMPNTCKSSDFFILANNPDSITVYFHPR